MAGCLSASLLRFGNQPQWIANEGGISRDRSNSLCQGPRNNKDRVQARNEVEPAGDAQRLSREPNPFIANCSSTFRHSSEHILKACINPCRITQRRIEVVDAT